MSLAMIFLDENGALLVGETRAIVLGPDRSVRGVLSNYPKVFQLGPVALACCGDAVTADKIVAEAQRYVVNFRGDPSTLFCALVNHMDGQIKAACAKRNTAGVSNQASIVGFDPAAGHIRIARWDCSDGPQPEFIDPCDSSSGITGVILGWHGVGELVLKDFREWYPEQKSVDMTIGGNLSKFLQPAFTRAAWANPTINDVLTFASVSKPTIHLISSPTTEVFTVPRTRDSVVWLKTRDAAGNVSRYPTMIHFNYPLPPNPPTVGLATLAPDLRRLAWPIILPADATDVYGVEIREIDDSTVVYQYADGSLSVTPDDPGLTWIWDNSVTLLRTKAWYVYTFNLLGEYSTKCVMSISGEAIEPIGSVISESGGGFFNFQWDYNAGWDPNRFHPRVFAQQFEVQLASDVGFTTDLETFFNIKDRIFTLKKPGVSRYFRVRPGDEMGYGDWAVYGSPTAVNSGT